MFFFFSHHLSAWYCKYCVDIMRKKSVLVSYGSKRIKKVCQNLSLNFFLVSHFQSVSILSILNCSCLFFHTFFFHSVELFLHTKLLFRGFAHTDAKSAHRRKVLNVVWPSSSNITRLSQIWSVHKANRHKGYPSPPGPASTSLPSFEHGRLGCWFGFETHRPIRSLSDSHLSSVHVHLLPHHISNADHGVCGVWASLDVC